MSVGIGLLTNGISNTIAGKPFLEGAARTIAFSVLTYGFSTYIGGTVYQLGLQGVDKLLFQAVAHGLAGGIVSSMQGGKFIHGFSSGAISSIASSASISAGALKNGPVITIAIGGVSGGLASVVSGGDFFSGFRYGVIAAIFNHITHDDGQYGGVAETDGTEEPPKIGDTFLLSVGNNGAFFLYTYTKSGWISRYYPGSSAVQTTDSPLEWGLGISLKSIKLVSLNNTALAQARIIGANGEKAVGLSGVKTAINIAGKTRIPDALTKTTLTEVKNVKSLSFTSQLRDFLTYSQQHNLDFILYTRSNTILSGSLQQAINNGLIIHRIIPGL